MIGIYGLLGFALVMWWRIAKTRAEQQKAGPKPKKPKRKLPGWKRIGLYAGAVGIIALCEAMVPSTRLTGMDVPPRVEPARHLDDIAWSETRTTFADIAETAPWLWHLGYLDRAEMIRRLDADIAEAEAQLALAKPLGAGGTIASTFQRQYTARVAELELLIGGLTGARSDVDTLFNSPVARISGDVADAFVQNALEAQADAQLAETNEVRAQAMRALAIYLEARGLDMNDTDGLDDPEYLALQKAIRDADAPMYRNLTMSNRIKALSYGQPPEPIADRPSRLFPSYAAALPIFEEQITADAPEAPQSGPAPGLATEGPRLLLDAFTGKKRANGRVIEEQRCAILITGDPAIAEKICEAAVVLPIDYDLTGTGCADAGLTQGAPADLDGPGTRRAGDVCKEAWTFPHLNIVYRADSFTVHAPRPVAVDGSIAEAAPLSQWTAIWQGISKPLAPSATFAWDGTSLILPELALRHDVRPGASDVRIWRDLRLGRGGATVMEAITGQTMQADHAYTPVRLDGLSLTRQVEMVAPVMSLGVEGAELVQTGGWPITSLRTSLAEQRALLNNAARYITTASPSEKQAAREKGLPADRCDYYRFVLSSNTDIDDREELARRMRRASSTPCDAVKAYGAVLESLWRGTYAGSWLWMVLD